MLRKSHAFACTKRGRTAISPFGIPHREMFSGNRCPELLLIDPPTNLVIESQLTWQTFYAESALKMAAKHKQIEMLKIMMPYLDQLEQENKDEVAQAKAAVLAAWNPQDKMVVPREYVSYVQSLIDVFTAETFPNGVNGKFSEKTELVLSSLFNCLIPKKAVKLDDKVL
ncbi:MAG: hypothetical protein A3E85_00520 [Gammaproteobacteria bacterium RIFCSPHIGHO2_12_FULL_45_12]|nr:MAG: hypothetical protein A3E85_00520 [Gammaproteobacteria bacterium RIFCSPHIGHO2_12_FULL_45_12]